MKIDKKYLRGIFTWVIPDSDDEPHFVWKVSPDGRRPAGIPVETNAVSGGKTMKGKIRVGGILHTVEKIKSIYEIEK